MVLSVGDSVKDIPEYSKPLKTHDGLEVTLSSFIGTSPVVIFFYPKAATPGCTKEACSFRDEYSKFTNKAKVFGISSDNAAANEKFATNQSLPYPLLSDEGGKLRHALGVKKHLLGFLPGRQTFVIDADGKVLLSFHNISYKKHASEALEALDKATSTTNPSPTPASTPAVVPEQPPATTTPAEQPPAAAPVGGSIPATSTAV